MVFAHDTETALLTAAALVNTASASAGDTLTTRAELDAFVRQWQFTGSRTHDRSELEAVRQLRAPLRRLWTCQDDEEVVAGVNAMLRDAGALPQLVRHDHWGWHLHATSPDQPLVTRMAVEAAMALVDVVRSDELDRLRLCDADDCSDVLVDLSKNRSRRYCDAGCGNRVNVAAYRARRAGTGVRPGEPVGQLAGGR